MDLLSNDRNPETCRSLGMDCRSCVQRSASAVASICGGMTETGVRSVFAQMYNSPGCAPMAGAFAASYYEATSPRKPMIRAVAAA